MTLKNKKIIRTLLYVLALFPFAAVIFSLILVGIFAEIPSFEELENPKNNLATELISEDGKVINTFHVENRSYVSYEELSPYLVQAAVSTEDVRFYEHSGIDFISLVRVGVKSILLGDKRSGGGGSTITQQLAKSLFPRENTDWTFPGANKVQLVINKFKEWITAVKLERNYTKNEIMTMYMNSIFFGSNAYGIKAAANTFFNKEPWELNAQESACLVGMVNKPTGFNPVLHYDKSIARRNHVISQMGKYGFIGENVADSLMALPIELSFRKVDHNSGLAPYFRDMIRRYMNATEPSRRSYYFEEDYLADLDLWENDPLYGWLNKNRKPDGSKYNLDRDGLKIYTTIDSRMQRYAEEAVDEHLGGYLQKAFTREMSRKPNAPFAIGTNKTTIKNLLNQAKKWSDRYQSLKRDNISEKEIDEIFNTPVEMRVFSWNRQGYVDTTMTPMDSIKYYKSYLRAALIAMEPNTGHVKAYVGGPDYRFFKYDNATQGKRQVGSTIKPFLYTLAMQEGMSPCDKVLNVPQTFIVGDSTYTPNSTDGSQWIGKTVTLKWGLTKSSNNISAYLMKQFGPMAMVEMCRKLGITTYLAPYPSLCLGPADITLKEMVAAFNTYPSRGVHVSPLYVTRIEDNDGNVLGTFNTRKREAISESTAYLMVNLMQGVVNEGTASRLRWKYQLKGNIAGKTGTTNDQSDGWFIGYTPKLTAGVWVGAEDRQIHFETLAMGSGSNMSLPIWGIFMRKVIDDPELSISLQDEFQAPPGLVLNLDCDGTDNDVVGGTENNRDNEETPDELFFN